MASKKEEKKKAEELKKLNDRIYSYMRPDSKGVLRRYSFRYEDREAQDIIHFVREIGKEFDRAPIDSQVTFMLMALPKIKSFLEVNEPEMYAELVAAIMPKSASEEGDELKVVN